MASCAYQVSVAWKQMQFLAVEPFFRKPTLIDTLLNENFGAKQVFSSGKIQPSALLGMYGSKNVQCRELTLE